MARSLECPLRPFSEVEVDHNRWRNGEPVETPRRDMARVILTPLARGILAQTTHPYERIRGGSLLSGEVRAVVDAVRDTFVILVQNHIALNNPYDYVPTLQTPFVRFGIYEGNPNTVVPHSDDNGSPQQQYTFAYGPGGMTIHYEGAPVSNSNLHLTGHLNTEPESLGLWPVCAPPGTVSSFEGSHIHAAAPSPEADIAPADKWRLFIGAVAM